MAQAAAGGRPLQDRFFSSIIRNALPYLGI